VRGIRNVSRLSHVSDTLGSADVDRVAATDVSGDGVAADGLDATGHRRVGDISGTEVVLCEANGHM